MVQNLLGLSGGGLRGLLRRYKSYITNVKWLAADRALHVSLNLLAGVWVARYMGPQTFGAYSYALALFTVTAPVAQLGLQSVVVRELVSSPEDEEVVLGSAAVLRLLAGVVVALGLLGAAAFQDGPQAGILMLLALAAPVQAAQIFELYFQAKVRAKYAVVSRLAATTTQASYKVLLIVGSAGAVWFGLGHLLAAAVAGVIGWLLYAAHTDSKRAVVFSRSRALGLLRESWPLMLSGIAIVLYIRADQVMLGMMAEAAVVGHYAVAAKLTEVWYFVPTAIATTLYPSIISAKNKGEGEYRRKVQLLFYVATGCAYAILLSSLLAGPVIIDLLFGAEYGPAKQILLIHVWGYPFIFLGVARGRILVVEELTRFYLVSTLCGCICNIVLNWVLIPRYGGSGAAAASVVGQAVAAYLVNFGHRRLWNLQGIMTRAVLLPSYLLYLMLVRAWGALVHARNTWA